MPVIGPHLAGPLAQAIADLVRRARHNGQRIPYDDLEYLQQLLITVSRGQERSDLDAPEPDTHAAPVPVALLTVEQAATALNVSERTVRRLITNGDLASVQVTAGTVRIRTTDFDAYIAGMHRRPAGGS